MYSPTFHRPLARTVDGKTMRELIDSPTRPAASILPARAITFNFGLSPVRPGPMPHLPQIKSSEDIQDMGEHESRRAALVSCKVTPY